MKLSIYLIAITLLLNSCTKSDSTNPIIENPDEIIGSSTAMNAAIEDFGFEAFHKVFTDEDAGKNVLISPLSLQAALFMTINGAEAETFDEMRAALALDSFNTAEGINTVFSDLLDLLDKDKTSDTYLEMAHSVFYEKGRIELKDKFNEAVKSEYNADVFDDRFTPEAVNAWANEKTNGRIPKVIDKIDAEELMFLLNALYFIGDWKYPFAEELTFDRDFFLEGGSTMKVPFMQADGNHDFYDGDDMLAVDLKFKGEKFAMTFLLPPSDINTYLGDNDASSLKNVFKDVLAAKLTSGRAVLSLPKFEFSYKKSMSEILKELGMKRAFNGGQAQFGNFGTASGNLFITKVLHDTYLKIDEKGAEGAAVTTVGVGATSVPPPLTFDRPFLVQLRHVETNIPIFIGAMQNPDASE